VKVKLEGKMNEIA